MTSHRHSLPNTLRFESVLRAILTNLGQGVSINFSPLDLGINANTARARLTDSIQALLSGKTTLPNFDVEKLRTLRPLFYITTNELERVVVSPKTKKEVKDAIPSLAGTQDTSSGVLAVLDPSTPQFLDRLRAFALLLGHRDLSGQVKVLGVLNNEVQADILSHFDIAFAPDNNNDTLMF